RRKILCLFLAQLAQRGSVTIDDIRVVWLHPRLIRLLPLKIDMLPVLGPSRQCGLIAVKFRAAHDVVDGECELLLCRDLPEQQCEEKYPNINPSSGHKL